MVAEDAAHTGAADVGELGAVEHEMATGIREGSFDLAGEFRHGGGIQTSAQNEQADGIFDFKLANEEHEDLINPSPDR